MKRLIKFIFVLAGIFIIQTLIISFVLQYVMMGNTEKSLLELQNRLDNDLSYSNGKWDTTRYNADPRTPHPHGTGGFINPLYIVTAEGFVIERNQPIKGFLDGSDFKHLLTFQQAQTIGIVTNEQWRVLSKPLVDESGSTVGIIFVAYHNPLEISLQGVDEKLQKNIRYIESAIEINGSETNTSRVDIRAVDYDVAFEVVNKFNKVLLNNGRTPSFIDPSYIDRELKKESKMRTIANDQTNEMFLISTKPVNDEKGNPIGIIVAGQSLEGLYTMLYQYVVVSLILNGILVFPITFLFIKWTDGKSKGTVEQKVDVEPKEVTFDHEKSVILIGETEIGIPKNTNQYFLAWLLFSQPDKRWEIDEIVKHFRDMNEQNHWRAVYDAALTINRKTGIKIVEYKKNTYMLSTKISAILPRGR